MTKHLHIVFSQPPEWLSEEEFNRWYDAHVAEILEVTGFVSARRFRLDPVVANTDTPVPFRYLALYELEGDPDTALVELEKAGLGSKDLYAELKEVDSGALPLPDWFDQVRFASWNAISLGDRVESTV